MAEATSSCVECDKQTDSTLASSTGNAVSEPSDSNTTAYNLLDPSTFIPPTELPVPSVNIEFCNRCRWLHRATWVSTELLLTFPPPTLKGVNIVPLNSDDTAGRFRVWLSTEKGPMLAWDRKIKGGFPELKELKQIIRDIVQPGQSLGHSDKSSSN